MQENNISNEVVADTVEKVPQEASKEVPVESQSKRFSENYSKKNFIIGALLGLLILFMGVRITSYKNTKQSQITSIQTENLSPSSEQASPAVLEQNDDELHKYIELDKYVYIDENNGEITQRNADSLRNIGLIYIDDAAKKVYYLKTNDGEKSPRLAHAAKIDLNTFAVYGNTNVFGEYVHDSKNVYALFGDGYDVIEYSLYTIKDADPLTFEPNIVAQYDVSQGNGYQGYLSKDKNHVYYQETIFEHADPVSFVITDNVSINKDKNAVFLWRKVLPKADPETYQILKDESAAHPGTVYGKDKNYVFVDYCLVYGVDGGSAQMADSLDPYIHRFADKSGFFTIDYDQEKNTCSAKRE